MAVELESVVLDDRSQQQFIRDNVEFPKILKLTSSSSLEECIEWLKSNQSHIEEQLTNHGALILRDFPTKTPQEFHDFLISFDWNFTAKYPGGGGPRNIVIGPIYNSTDSPPDFIIPFHHEMAYLTKFPERLIFYCDIVPGKDGETPLLYSNDVIKQLKEINPTFVKTLQEKGVRYIRTVESKHTGGEKLKYQKSWQDIFETEDKSVVESVAKECGTETITWDGDTVELTTKKFDGVAVEQETQTETWLNAICLLHPAAHKGKEYVPWRVVYGDFSEIADSDVESAIDVMAKAGVKPKWEHGDMMFVNNRLAMHGRNHFTPPRQILAAFAS